MARRRLRFWIGDQGPFLYTLGEGAIRSPFRWEEVVYEEILSDPGTSITVNKEGEARETSRPTTTRAVARQTGLTDLDPISSSEYTAYRAAHFNSFGSQL